MSIHLIARVTQWLQTDSPEYADLPVSDLRIPVFADMTERQKADYVELCGIEM